jgi:predicted RNA-binding protein with PUA domain
MPFKIVSKWCAAIQLVDVPEQTCFGRDGAMATLIPALTPPVDVRPVR